MLRLRTGKIRRKHLRGEDIKRKELAYCIFSFTRCRLCGFVATNIARTDGRRSSNREIAALSLSRVPPMTDNESVHTFYTQSHIVSIIKQ